MSEQDLKNKIKELEEEKKNLNKELDKTKKTLQSTEKDLQKKTKEINTSKNKSEVSKLYKQLEELQQENEQLVQQLHSLQDLIRSQPAEASKEEEDTELAVLRKTAENVEAELTQLQGLYADAQMKIFDYESEIESLKQDAEIIEKEHKIELEKLKDELSKSIPATNASVTSSSVPNSVNITPLTPPPAPSLNKMNRVQSATVVSTGNKATDEKIALLQSQIASQFESMDEAEAKHQDEVKVLNDNIELWKEKYNKCQLKIEEVERELSEVKENCMDFETKLEFENEKNENLQKQIEELKVKADAKANKEEVYKKGLEDLEDKIYELNNKLSEEKNNRREAVKEKLQIEEDIATYKNKIEEMNQEIEDARFDNGVLLKKSVQMIKDLQNEMKKLNKSIEKLKSDHKKEIEKVKRESSNSNSNQEDSPKREKKRFGRDNNNNNNNDNGSDSAIVEKLNQITQENCDYKMKIESMSSIIEKLKEQLNNNSGGGNSGNNNNSMRRGSFTFAAGDAITEGLQQKINELHEEITKLKKNNNKLSRDIEKYKMKAAVSLDKESKDVMKRFETQIKDNQKLKDKLDEIFEKSKIFKDRCDMLAQENFALVKELKGHGVHRESIGTAEGITIDMENVEEVDETPRSDGE